MNRFSIPLIWSAFFWLILGNCAAQNTIAKGNSNHNAKLVGPANLDQVVIKAYEATHAGWSSDEVILNDQLNDAFIAACQEQLPSFEPADFNWRLMNLRKAGKLKIRTTKSNRSSSPVTRASASFGTRQDTSISARRTIFDFD